MATTIGVRDELQKMIGGNASKERKRKYFLWKNKMDTTQTRYSEMSKEEFIEFSKVNTRELAYLERWEESDKYKQMVYMLYSERFDDDILEVYNAVKENAKNGNATAVKTMLDLQKTIKDRLEKIDSKDDKKKGKKTKKTKKTDTTDTDKPDLILKV